MTMPQRAAPYTYSSIADIRRLRLDQTGPDPLAAITRLSAGAAEAQYGRWLLELAQNAEDALHRSGQASGKLAVVQHGADLLVANDGDAFTLGDVHALVAPGLSGKGRAEEGQCEVCGLPRAETVGHKGIGFSATRELSESVLVSSRREEHSVRFRVSPSEVWPEYRAQWRAEILRAVALGVSFWRDVDIDGDCPPGFPPLAPLAWDDVPDIVEDLHRRGYHTVFLFPGGAPVGEARSRLIDTFDGQLGPALLFFRHLTSLRLELDGAERTLQVGPGERSTPLGWSSAILTSSCTPGGSERTEWLVVRGEREAVPRELRPHAAESGQVECAAAVPVEPQEGRGHLCVHYPTEQPSGSATHLHADFRTDPSRRNVDRQTSFNRWMLGRLEFFFVQVVVPGLVEQARSELGPEWLLRVLAHKPRAGDIAERFWDHVVPQLKVLPVVPGLRRGELTYVQPDEAVRFKSEAAQDRPGLLPGGLYERALVPSAIAGRAQLAELLERLGVVLFSERDLDDLRQALERAQPAGVAEALWLLEALRETFGHALRDTVQTGLRALPLYPYENGDEDLTFTTATRTMQRRPADPEVVRIWLNAEKVPPPPRQEARRHLLVHRELQFDSDDREREIAGWLRATDIVAPQEGRPLVEEVGSDLAAEWSRSPDDPLWSERWRRFYQWALDVYLMAAATPPTSGQLAAFADMPLPCRQGSGPLRLLRIRELVLPGADSEIEALLNVPGPDCTVLSEWLSTPEREARFSDDSSRELVPHALWNFFGVPKKIMMMRVPIPVGQRQPYELSERPELQPAAYTESGQALQHRLWRSWREAAKAKLGHYSPVMWAGTHLVSLPPWAYDLLANADDRSPEEFHGRLEALYRILDTNWRSDDGDLEVKKNHRTPVSLLQPAAHALRTEPWLPCTDGQLRAPTHTVHLRGTADDLVLNVLPAVPSEAYGAFERVLGVGDVKDWERLARLIREIVDRFDGENGLTLTRRNDWIRTIHGLLQRLSRALDALAGEHSDAELRKVLAREMPRLPARVDGVPQARRWADGLIFGVPAALAGVLPFGDPVLYFGEDKLKVLVRVLGARHYSKEPVPPTRPAWEELGRLPDDFMGGLRELVAAIAVFRGRRGVELERPRSFELRIADGLSIGSKEVPFVFIDERRIVATRNHIAHALTEAFRELEMPLLVGIETEDLATARRVVSGELGIPTEDYGEIIEQAAADRPPTSFVRPHLLSGLQSWRLPDEVREVEPSEGETKATVPEPLDGDALAAAVELARAGGELSFSEAAAPDRIGASAEVSVGRRITPRNPNRRVGKTAEAACQLNSLRRYPGLKAHDVTRIPFYGADFVLTVSGAPPPPRDGQREAAEKYLMAHARGLLECKGTEWSTPTHVLFTETEVQMAEWANRAGVAYEVEVWRVEVRDGHYVPTEWYSAPAPLEANVRRVNATYAFRTIVPGR